MAVRPNQLSRRVYKRLEACTSFRGKTLKNNRIVTILYNDVIIQMMLLYNDVIIQEDNDVIILQVLTKSRASSRGKTRNTSVIHHNKVYRIRTRCINPPIVEMIALESKRGRGNKGSGIKSSYG